MDHSIGQSFHHFPDLTCSKLALSNSLSRRVQDPPIQAVLTVPTMQKLDQNTCPPTPHSVPFFDQAIPPNYCQFDPADQYQLKTCGHRHQVIPTAVNLWTVRPELSAVHLAASKLLSKVGLACFSYALHLLHNQSNRLNLNTNFQYPVRIR